MSRSEMYVGRRGDVRVLRAANSATSPSRSEPGATVSRGILQPSIQARRTTPVGSASSCRFGSNPASRLRWATVDPLSHSTNARRDAQVTVRDRGVPRGAPRASPSLDFARDGP